MKFRPLFATWLALLVTLGPAPTGWAARGERPKKAARPSSAAANPGIYEVQDPGRFSEVIALSDVHGRSKSTQKLLQAHGLVDAAGNWTGGSRLLVVVGDSIGKGKHSIPVLELWAKLADQARAAGGEVVHTLGNHEAKLLANPAEYLDRHPELAQELKLNRLNPTTFTRSPSVIGTTLRKMPVGARVGNVLFIHSGFVEHENWAEMIQAYAEQIRQGEYGGELLLGANSVLEQRGWDIDHELPKMRKNFAKLRKMGITTVVFGHDPKAFTDQYVREIFAYREDGMTAIKLDTGMGGVEGSKKSRGKLLYFNDVRDMFAPVLDDRLLWVGDRRRKIDPSDCNARRMMRLFYVGGAP